MVRVVHCTEDDVAEYYVHVFLTLIIHVHYRILAVLYVNQEYTDK